MTMDTPLGARRLVEGAGIPLSVAVAGTAPHATAGTAPHATAGAAPHAGTGKLVILMHGWPESGLSWRHQVPALVAAGYRVATPDMRGYGASGKPAAPEAYTLDLVARDMAAVAAALGAARWVAVGHDWGALAAWRCALAFPDQVHAVVGMSVPHTGPAPLPVLDLIDRLYPDRFFYIRYFQALGVAEAELEAADTAAALKRIFFDASGAGMLADRPPPAPRNATLLEALGPAPAAPLPFMTDAELEEYARAFAAGGWRGPLNWYRNFDRNAADARALGDSVIRQPAAFIAGEHEPVLRFWPGQIESQRRFCADLRLEARPEGAGHWVQQEAAAETNVALLSFLRDVAW